MQSPHLLQCSKWGEDSLATDVLRHGCHAVHIAVTAGTIAAESHASDQSMPDELFDAGEKTTLLLTFDLW
jgi:hypothetical protein